MSSKSSNSSSGSGNSYRKLVSTTLILAVGSFSSKVLVLIGRAHV